MAGAPEADPLTLHPSLQAGLSAVGVALEQLALASVSSAHRLERLLSLAEQTESR